jgi:hypothetical protein
MPFFDTVPDGFLPTAEEAAELDARNQGRRQQLLPEEAKETDSEGSEIDDTNPTTNLNCPGSRLLLKPTTRLKPSLYSTPTTTEADYSTEAVTLLKPTTTEADYSTEADYY